MIFGVWVDFLDIHGCKDYLKTPLTYWRSKGLATFETAFAQAR